jgi:hypothetical protein
MFVPSKDPPRARSIPDAQVREIVKRVLADSRIQRAAAKLAKTPAPAPFRKVVSTTPSALPLAKLERRVGEAGEAVDALRKLWRDDRAAQRDINARLDRVGQKLDDVGEISRRIAKVATGVERIARAFETRGLGLPRGGMR